MQNSFQTFPVTQPTTTRRPQTTASTTKRPTTTTKRPTTTTRRPTTRRPTTRKPKPSTKRPNPGCYDKPECENYFDWFPSEDNSWVCDLYGNPCCAYCSALRESSGSSPNDPDGSQDWDDNDNDSSGGDEYDYSGNSDDYDGGDDDDDYWGDSRGFYSKRRR